MELGQWLLGSVVLAVVLNLVSHGIIVLFNRYWAKRDTRDALRLIKRRHFEELEAERLKRLCEDQAAREFLFRRSSTVIGFFCLATLISLILAVGVPWVPISDVSDWTHQAARFLKLFFGLITAIYLLVAWFLFSDRMRDMLAIEKATGLLQVLNPNIRQKSDDS